ncbi:unnamed protein product [Prorocentrum cordatum]|uniref:Uncharacterized protein n=1 Tax=Prorocentrum cordatum TaxID=2364126 RepID=A0ABN9UW08_9DINO|nr:unnamed protein product [Polarella glacialis]
MPGLASQHWQRRHVAPIFGLPFCGKSHIARELKRRPDGGPERPKDARVLWLESR